MCDGHPQRLTTYGLAQIGPPRKRRRSAVGGRRRSAVGGGRRSAVGVTQVLALETRCRTVKQALRGRTDVTKQLQSPMPPSRKAPCRKAPCRKARCRKAPCRKARCRKARCRHAAKPHAAKPHAAKPHAAKPDAAMPQSPDTTEIHNTNDLCNLHNHLASQRLTQRSYRTPCGATP